MRGSDVGRIVLGYSTHSHSISTNLATTMSLGVLTRKGLSHQCYQLKIVAYSCVDIILH